MFSTFINMFRVADIRSKILFTLGVLIIFRLGTFIPVPFTDKNALTMMDEVNSFGFIDTFGGGALSQFSIFAMGVFPYITAMIIMQLLQMDVVPKFTEWRKQGEQGRKKLTQVTRYGTVGLAFLQGIGMSVGFNAMTNGSLIQNPSIMTYFVIAIVLTGGTTFLMWLGEQITEYGVGNGISILIFAGIIAGFPNAINQLFEQYISGAGDQLFINIAILAIILLVVVAIIVGVIFIQQALRKIPIQYAKRTVNRSPVGGHSAHLPLKVNAAGVIPIIFAISFVIAPQTVAGFFEGNEFASTVQYIFDYTQPIGMVIYVGLIIAFTYFYTFVQVNPE